MRVHRRLLALVPVLAAIVACGVASLAAAGSAARPICDPDNGGLNLPGRTSVSRLSGIRMWSSRNAIVPRTLTLSGSSWTMRVRRAR
jgi:hypothetical protein